MSAAGPTTPPPACSGERYRAVPRMEPVAVNVRSPAARAILSSCEFHHEQVRGAVLTVVVNVGDVRVRQRCDGARLTFEPLHETRVEREFSLEDLDRDESVQSLVHCFVDG